MPEEINHPPHYAEGRKHEPIDVIEDWNLDFNLGNSVKYISRAGRKGDALADLRKACWYLNRAIQAREKAGRVMCCGIASSLDMRVMAELPRGRWPSRKVCTNPEGHDGPHSWEAE